MSESVVHDWPAIMSTWTFAFGEPSVTGQLKASPEDFEVVENLGFDPGEGGEHIWLYIAKRQQNTDAVAKALAKHANVAYRDVGYSGLKDFHACTSQWFSIYKPGGDGINWNDFKMPGVEIKINRRHNRKIRRGSHQSNSFVIRVRDIQGDIDQIDDRAKKIINFGAPNYFGEQRFGRGLRNLSQAHDLLVSGKRIKNRHLQSLLFSSARSWLFNCIVSKRIEDETWANLYPSEPANLNGSNSIFKAENQESEKERLLDLDIHPTAPLWGKFDLDRVHDYAELHAFEQSVIRDYNDLSTGLELANLDYQRRPTRLKVNNLVVQKDDDSIVLRFELLKGQYATSVLRELLLAQ